MTPELEAILTGLFLSLYCSLSAEGAARARDCLAAFATDPDAFPAERRFFFQTLALLEAGHVHGQTADAPRPLRGIH